MFICRFDQCFVKFKAEQAASKVTKGKTRIPEGNKLTSKEMNHMIKTKWPQSMRTRQSYLQPDFDPMKKKKF